MTVGYFSLTKESQKIEREKYISEAQDVERGCEFHFWQSAERIKANGGLIPRPQSRDFESLLRRMVSVNTGPKEFQELVDMFSTQFPSVYGWLKWWLKPTISPMIFPACRSPDFDISSMVPKTSNPSEHQHSLLHHAAGSDQDLLPGIKLLYLHVTEIERQYTAIKGELDFITYYSRSQRTLFLAGHYNPAPPREHRVASAKKFEENDGRPPDTEAVLHPRKVLDTSVSSAAFLLAYKWRAPNSCFFDGGLEIWFRAYSTWPEDVRQSFLSIVPHDSFLGSAFYHFDRRIKLIKGGSTLDVIHQALDMMQTMTLHYIFERWKLYPIGSHGCAMQWLSHAVRVSYNFYQLSYFVLTYIFRMVIQAPMFTITSR